MSLKMLRRRIGSIVDWVDGTMGVAVHDVSTGEEIGVAMDDWFPMASVCKMPILVEAYRRAEKGQISLDKRLRISRRTRVHGSGVLNYCDPGLRPSIKDLLLFMIVVSDNAATDIVLSEIGGASAVTSAMEELGLSRIRLHRTIRQLLQDIHIAIDPGLMKYSYDGFESLSRSNEPLAAALKDETKIFEAVRTATAGKDEATPRDIARLYAMVCRNECAGAESCAAILKTLERQQLRGRLPRILPPRARCCHKTGTLGNGAVCNDTGIIFVRDRAVAIAVLSKEVRQDPADTSTAISRIGRAVYDHFDT